MNVEIRHATLEDKPLLSNLLELYQYDIAEYANDGWRDIGEDGHYGYPYLDSYWEDTGRAPFLVYVDGRIAGFVLVNEHSLISLPHTKSIAEFFIMRKYRGKGVGRQAALAVFEKFPGPWEVAQDEKNPNAQKFWHSIITDFTGGKFSKTLLHDEKWRGPVLTFVVAQSQERKNPAV